MRVFMAKPASARNGGARSSRFGEIRAFRDSSSEHRKRCIESAGSLTATIARMCGRTSLKASPEEIAEAFGLREPPDWTPRYNIAPTQPIPIVRMNRAGDARELHAVRFGLVPFWEKSAGGARHLNARVETLFTARPFAAAARRRRCLVVADGFYEWAGPSARSPEPKSAPRAPYHVHFVGDAPFALAGVWERWTSNDGEVVESCAIVTAPARGVIAPLHDRMPLFVPRESYPAWLGAVLPRDAANDAEAAALAHTLAESTPPWVATPIARYVNDPRHEGPECLAPPEPATPASAGPSAAESLPLFGADEVPARRSRRR